MACPFNKDNLTALKSIVDTCKSNPEVLHKEELKFFKEFVESFGGQIPKRQKMEEPKINPAEGKPQEAEESDTESVLEFDMEGCLEADTVTDEQVMGDDEKKPTEEEIDKADEVRGQGMHEFSEGNYEKAIQFFTEAIQMNPKSAILFTKRGQSYIKMNKPNACIQDCTKALDLNCDSAAAFKFRGRAYRLLGEWEKAAHDLRQACKIDFDEQSDEWLKEVQPNALKIQQHKIKQERKNAEKLKEKPKETANQPPPNMPNLADFLKDPMLREAMNDPEISAAFNDIVLNPNNMDKYVSNPKFAAFVELLKKWSNFPNPDFGKTAPPAEEDGLD